MTTFNPKIYFNDNQKLVLDLLSDGQVVVVDDLMPPSLRIEQFDREKFEIFWQASFPVWLVDNLYLEKASQGTDKNPVLVPWREHIDLEQFGLVDGGRVNENRVRFIIGLVAKYWQYQAQPALLFQIYKTAPSDDVVSDFLAKLANPKTMQFDLSRLDKVQHEAFDALNAKSNLSRQASGLAGAPKKIGRNDLCPCGSGKKYKKCCGGNSTGTGD